MENVRTKFTDVLVTGYKQNEDGSYVVYFRDFTEDGKLKRYSAVLNDELYFSNIISSEENGAIWLDLVVDNSGTPWEIIDILLEEVSLLHKDDWAISAFRAKKGSVR